VQVKRLGRTAIKNEFEVNQLHINEVASSLLMRKAHPQLFDFDSITL
jgi:hypothetical protein